MKIELIGEKTIESISKKVSGLLRQYHSDINAVYENEGEIKISMPVKIKHEKGANSVVVGISFVTNKIDDTSSGFVEEAQLSLFDEPQGRLVKCPLRPDDEEVFASYCNGKCKDRRVALMINGADMPHRTAENPRRIPETSMIQYRSCSQWEDDDTRASVEAHLEAYDRRVKEREAA